MPATWLMFPSPLCSPPRAKATPFFDQETPRLSEDSPYLSSPTRPPQKKRRTSQEKPRNSPKKRRPAPEPRRRHERTAAPHPSPAAPLESPAAPLPGNPVPLERNAESLPRNAVPECQKGRFLAKTGGFPKQTGVFAERSWSGRAGQARPVSKLDGIPPLPAPRLFGTILAPPFPFGLQCPLLVLEPPALSRSSFKLFSSSARCGSGRARRRSCSEVASIRRSAKLSLTWTTCSLEGLGSGEPSSSPLAVFLGGLGGPLLDAACVLGTRLTSSLITLPNDPAQAGRGNDARLQTETQSRPCLKPACSLCVLCMCCKPLTENHH